MSTEAASSDSMFSPEEDQLRNMWQEAEDTDKKKEIRSEMYKAREERLKDLYNTGEQLSDSSESRNYSTTTRTTKTSHSNVGGFKASDLTTHADSLADHSFLSLKSKEIRDSESPTKDAYKIIETRNLTDRDWNVVESNEKSKDGKTHTTSRIATTSGKEDLEGGEMKYAGKSEQKASVYKDGDDQNFTKSTAASSHNVIKQEAHGGDDNSKFYSSSTTKTSSSKTSSEHRSTTGDLPRPLESKDRYERTTNVRGADPHRFDVHSDDSAKTVVRKIYSENVPNELKNHPNYVDGRTKVTTETRTLPDGSTVTTTRYETIGSSTSSSSRHVSSNTQQQQTSNTLVKDHRFTTEENTENVNKRTIPKDIRGDRIIKNDLAESVRTENFRDENIVKRTQDLNLLGRDSKGAHNVEITITKQELPVEEKRTVTTTVTKTINSNQDIKDSVFPVDNNPAANTTARTVVTNKSYVIPALDQNQTNTTSTVRTKTISTKYDKQQDVASDFLDTERQHVSQTRVIDADIQSNVDSIRTPQVRKEINEYVHVIEKQIGDDAPNKHKPIKPTDIETPQKKNEQLDYGQPERRQPIKPGKSEWDDKQSPTEGQYDTTYTTDYVPRRISVEVSPTHDAFARSLRSISPDRVSKAGSTRSLRTISSTSLRSTNSPDRSPTKINRGSPVNKRPADVVGKKTPGSPNTKGPQRTVNANTTTKTITTERSDVDSSTLTKRNRANNERARSRSVSPTSVASDIEFIRHHKDVVTDLDADDIKMSRRHTQEFDQRSLPSGTPTKRPSKVTDKSATLPLTDRKTKSPVKEVTPETKPKTKPIRRTDTYEERCKEILGIGKDTPRTGKSPQKEPLEYYPDEFKADRPQAPSVQEFPSQTRKPPQKEPTEQYPDKPKGERPQAPSIHEFPSQIRKSPQKEPLGPYPDKRRDDSPHAPSVQEFPSQTKKPSQKEPLEPYPDKPKGGKPQAPSVNEFPSQIRKSPQKEPLGPYPDRRKDDSQHAPSAQEFPSQTKKPSQKEPLEPYPDKPKGGKLQAPSVNEFPSQIRKSPQKEPLEPYSDKPKGGKPQAPSVNEFPSQIRKSPQKEPLGRYPDKRTDDSPHAPSVQEFPSQTKKPSQKEPLEPYPDKPKGGKPQAPSVNEFPSQIRKSPQKEPLEPYSDKPKGGKPQAPSVNEFPSQIRKSPQKEPLEPYPDKRKDDVSQKPSVQEFPSQTRRSPQKESLEPYPDKPKGDRPQKPGVQEFPSQIKRPSQKEPLEPYLDKPKGGAPQAPSVHEFPSQIRKSPQKELHPDKLKTDKPQPPSVQVFPSQTRRSPQKESLEPNTDKPKGDRPQKPAVQEFPSQIKRPSQKEPLEPYPDKPKGGRPQAPSVQEFPSQVRKSPQKEPLEPYPDQPKDDVSQKPPVQEFPSQTRRSPQKESLEPHPDKPKGDRPQKPAVQEFPSQIKRPSQKEPLEPYPDKPKGGAPQDPSVHEFPSQIRKSPQKERLEPYPDKRKDDVSEKPSVQEFPSQIKKPSQREPLEPSDRPKGGAPQAPSVQEFPSLIRKSPQKETLETHSDEPRTDKPQVPSVRELPSQTKKPQKVIEPDSDKPVKKVSPKKVTKEPSIDKPRIPKDKSSLSRPEGLDVYPDEPLLIKRPESDDDESDTDDSRPRHKVSLDDLPNIKMEKVSLDDIPTAVAKPDRQSHRKISLSDLNDNFVTREKIDTEITLKKYKDESIYRPRGTPDAGGKKKKPIKGKKTKKHVDEDDETESTTTEEEIVDRVESEVIEDIIVDHIDEEVINRRRLDKLEEVQKHSTKKEITLTNKRQPQELKSKPKPRTSDQVPQLEDFVTVTKTQLLQSASSKVPVEEPVISKRFISKLCKDDEQDRLTQKRTTLKNVDEAATKTSRKKIVKKPENVPKIKEKVTETLIRKEKLDINNKLTAKKSNVIKTEYNVRGTVVRGITNRVPVTSKVSTQVNLRPTKQVTLKKPDVDVDKTEKVITKRVTRPDDRRPAPKVATPPHKRRVEDQPKQPGKSRPNQVIKHPQNATVEIVPAKRHVVSTIINIKPKQKPETITKTIHKTTVTRTIGAPKSTKSITTPKAGKTKPVKPAVNGYDVSTDDGEDSDVVDVIVVEDIKSRQPKDQPQNQEKKRKCITTKSIVIENAIADQREIIVDLRRSKSSREATPDRICPFPISGDTDTSIPRYPDTVMEPENGTRPRYKPRKIADVPLDENEDVVEEFQRITEVTNREVESTDECLLSVNEKVNKFLTTAEKITKKPLDGKPAPKVERPSLKVEESLKEDECLLSVSDKVNRFIATAEQLSSKSTPKRRVPNESTEIIEDKDRSIHSPTRTRSSVSPDKRSSISPHKTSPDRRFDNAESKYNTPERRPSDLYVKRTTDLEETTQVKRQSLVDDTPKSSRRRPSEDEPRTVLSPTGRLRSTETIKKAKALFENADNEVPTVPRAVQRDVLSRPSVFEGRKLRQQRTDELSVTTTEKNEEIRKSVSPEKQPHRHHSADRSVDGEMPHYMTPLDRTVRDHKRENVDDVDRWDEESVQSRETTPDGEIPHYMLPLDRSLRERSPHKDNVKQLEEIMHRSLTHSVDEMDTKSTKFGVTLKRTDSGRKVTTTTVETPGRSPLDSLEIEEIFDLEYLIKLLETIVGYDIRKRIRTQIRLIKRAIEDNTIETLTSGRRKSSTTEIITSRTDREYSPSKRIPDRRHETTTMEKQVSEHHVISSATCQRKTSLTEHHSYKNKSPSPVRGKKERSPDKPSRIIAKSPSPVAKARSPVKDTTIDDVNKTVTTTTTTSTTSRRLFQTDLKRTKPPTTKIVVEEKPDLVTQRTTLRKVTETGAPIKKTVTTTVTQKSRVVKKEDQEQEPTDVITSSYGVGPTDEDGTPLFGLKALRTRNKSEKTKVQGTVIRSQFYSENGAEPSGEISVTEYSTDPNDLKTGNPTRERGGITSVTTTQKYGYKGTPTLKTLTAGKDKITENLERKSSVNIGAKVTRRGSVKEISQKFIENAVDTLKNEGRKPSYPKAGLILRTSGSPVNQEIQCKTISTVEPARVSDGQHKTGTFLTDRSKVTDVQDVIFRMKNDAEAECEDTEEDIEARNLLNKFIGSQVLLCGMESHVLKSSTEQQDSGDGKVQRTTEITTTTTTGSGSSKPTTITRTFTHPITEELLLTVWDEQTLKLLLEQSTDYEDRRIIRARLREVMAEQEACTELVEKASDEATTKESGSTVHGESLLLPLLQGLLDQPDNEQPADSGTESGEDLRTGLILEVQNALNKLSASLKNPRANISEERRESLLQLVNRLQSGLSASQLGGASLTSSSSSSNERRSSLHQARFSKRKQRPSRHTVGVTSEELEDARRLMEEIALHQSTRLKPECTSALQKQNSEGSVSQTAPFKPLSKPKPVKNVTAKPFISTNAVLATSQSQSSTSSAADTPSDTSKSLEFLLSNSNSEDKLRVRDDSIKDDGPLAAPPPFLHSQSLQHINDDNNDSDNPKRVSLTQTVSLDASNNRDTLDLIAVQKAVTQAAAIKQLSQLKKSNDVSDGGVVVVDTRADSEETDEDVEDDEDEEESDEDKEDGIGNVKNLELKQEKENLPLFQQEQPQQQQQPDLIMQTNPLYNNKNKSYNSADYGDNNNNSINNNSNNKNEENIGKCEIDDYPEHLNEKANRFNNKKLKMKRANTIDIPKPLKYYECDDEDSDHDDGTNNNNNRRNSYLALRGPIRVGGKTTVEKKVPDFQPKTENDKKFIAFLQNNNSSSNNYEPQQNKSSSIWCNNQQHQNRRNNVASNWSNKFGNIKNNFEQIQTGHGGVSSARNFWKSADDAVMAGKATYVGPKISRRSAQNLQQMFEEKQKEKHHEISPDANIVTGQLKVLDTGGKKVGTVVAKPMTQPNPVNQFSHAALSAFKPVPKKIEVATLQTRIEIPDQKSPEAALYLYSPKQVSPVNAPLPVPWNTGRTTGESRVLSIAASKFQNLQKQERVDPPAHAPRRLSKEKIVPTRPLQEKFNAPYMVKEGSVNSFVRKLSGQYDSLGNKDVQYTTNSPRVEGRTFLPGENYTIKYDRNVPTRIQPPQSEPRIYNAEYIIAQRLYNPPYIHNQPEETKDLRKDEAQNHNHKQRQMYSKINQTSQPVSGEVSPQEYASNYQIELTKSVVEKPPEIVTPKQDFPSDYDRKNFSYDRQTSQESIKEYTAVSSKVMSGPINQQAVVVQQNVPKSRDQHELEYSLKATLQKLSTTQIPQKSPERIPVIPPTKEDYKEPSLPPPPLVVYNNVKPRPSLRVNDQPLESLEINERGESILTGKFNIPIKRTPSGITSPPIALSKSESWHQICQVTNKPTSKPSARSSPASRPVTRSKSSHTLAVPKQFEAGMSKTEMLEKRKTMEAYFGSTSSKSETKKATASSINRVKTSQKVSTQRQNSGGMGGGLCRSKTLPDIVCSDKLDDGSIDAIFEDLFNNSKFTRQTTTTIDSPVTTTSQVTTRGSVQEQMKKPMSPFAKFRQLDKQNSLNSPPSTPKSPTGSGSLFKFTDPSLNQSANTVKQRLLQWCQMKTKEYENIQLDNFSTSWSDGMAFCALIHHFLPDTFDYSKLDPKNRRHNFTLAFRVADEKADIAPLLDVDDMVAIRRPDWKCVFTYVQSIYRRFKDED